MEIISDFIKQMESWPSSVLVVVALMFVGWAIKRDEFLPSKTIPSILMGLGSLIYVFVGHTGSISPEQRHPEIILALYGMILGVVAWITHGLVWKQIEKRLGSALNDDTEIISKPKEETKTNGDKKQ